MSNLTLIENVSFTNKDGERGTRFMVATEHGHRNPTGEELLADAERILSMVRDEYESGGDLTPALALMAARRLEQFAEQASDTFLMDSPDCYGPPL
jgi:hypothetical protein